jgi:selenium metabolism protein YedF
VLKKSGKNSPFEELVPLRREDQGDVSQLSQHFFCTFANLKPVLMRIVDTKGQNCPIPLIETRKALRASHAGEAFAVVTDDRTAFSNISRFLNDNRIKYSVSENHDTWTFNITNETGVSDTTPAENYFEAAGPEIPSGDFAVVISSEIMGQGDDELGRKLMKSFFVALSCLDTMPSSIMFYNSGVKLTANDSEIIEILHEIERKGVEILICGTCVDHFKIGNKINLGKICDMYFITQKLSEAGNIIRP